MGAERGGGRRGGREPDLEGTGGVRPGEGPGGSGVGLALGLVLSVYDLLDGLQDRLDELAHLLLGLGVALLSRLLGEGLFVLALGLLLLGLRREDAAGGIGERRYLSRRGR